MPAARHVACQAERAGPRRPQRGSGLPPAAGL